MIEPKLTKPKLTGVEPQLFVGDFSAALAFYKDKLGFAVVFTYGDPPTYAQVKRDAARLNLRHMDNPVIDPARRDGLELLSATVTTDDADALFAAFRASGAAFHEELTTKPWGARTFIVRDPDGNLILFAGQDAHWGPGS